MADNHVIGSGLTEQELQVASFWVRRRPLLRRLGYGALIAVNVIFWAFVLWSVLDAYVISYPRESQIPRVIAQNILSQQALEQTRPQSVVPSEVLVFDATEERQDFLVELTNPNPQWSADFTYRFDVNGELTPERTGYVLPQSRQFLGEFGWKSTTTHAVTAQLRVENVIWHRLDPDMVERDYAAFAAKRLQLEISDVGYANDLRIDNQTVGQTTFTLKNNSAYGFWGVDFFIVLYRLETPVAAQRVTLRDIRPGEVRPVTVHWFDNLETISRTDVRPSVNILDPSVFLPTSR